MKAKIGSLAGALALVAACGGDPPKVETEGQSEGTEAPSAPRKSGLGISQELGELDLNKTSATFEQITPRLQKCFADGAEKLPFLSGEVRLVVRINESGAARWAFVKESTLGDRHVEDCMLAIAKAATWPKPSGGEGVAEKGFTFDPGGDERPPVAWTTDRLGHAYDKVKGALAACKSGAGAGAMSVTMYVGTNGKAQAIGAASADEKGEQAVRCVVSALQGTTFPSPGSWAAKVTFSID